jgi:hypothetical protein
MTLLWREASALTARSDATFSILVHVKETGAREATPDVVGQGAGRVGRLLGVPLFFSSLAVLTCVNGDR